MARSGSGGGVRRRTRPAPRRPGSRAAARLQPRRGEHSVAGARAGLRRSQSAQLPLSQPVLLRAGSGDGHPRRDSVGARPGLLAWRVRGPVLAGSDDGVPGSAAAGRGGGRADGSRDPMRWRIGWADNAWRAWRRRSWRSPTFPCGTRTSIKHDVPATLLILVAVLASWRVWKRGRVLDYLLAGLSAGVAASFHYYGVYALVPLAGGTRAQGRQCAGRMARAARLSGGSGHAPRVRGGIALRPCWTTRRRCATSRPTGSSSWIARSTCTASWIGRAAARLPAGAGDPVDPGRRGRRHRPRARVGPAAGVDGVLPARVLPVHLEHVAVRTHGEPAVSVSRDPRRVRHRGAGSTGGTACARGPRHPRHGGGDSTARIVG